MDWQVVITVVLGSSLLSVVFDRLLQSFSIKQKFYNEEQRNLYIELGLLVRLACKSRQIREEAIKNVKEYGKGLECEDKRYIQRQVNDEMTRVNKELGPFWWSLIDRIKLLLETKTGFVRKKDREVVMHFFEAYLKRTLIGKDDVSQHYWFTEDKYDEYQDSIFKATEELLKISE